MSPLHTPLSLRVLCQPCGYCGYCKEEVVGVGAEFALAKRALAEQSMPACVVQSLSVSCSSIISHMLCCAIT